MVDMVFWATPRDELWMALPCWADLQHQHALLLDEEGLRLWLAIDACAGGLGGFPVARFLFQPDEATSFLACREGGTDFTDTAAAARTQARLNGAWLVEFEGGVVRALGAGTLTLDVVDTPGPTFAFARRQYGFFEFGGVLSGHARISTASVRRFFELTGQGVTSGRATIELAVPMRINACERGPEALVYGPSDSVAFLEIGLTLGRRDAANPADRVALVLRGYGPRKVEVVRLLMKWTQANAGDVAARVGDLAQPCQLMVGEPYEICNLLDRATQLQAAGADAYLRAASDADGALPGT